MRVILVHFMLVSQLTERTSSDPRCQRCNIMLEWASCRQRAETVMLVLGSHDLALFEFVSHFQMAKVDTEP